MPLLILGLLVIIAAVAYMYVNNNLGFFVRKKPETDPFSVIHLPEDLEEAKRRAKTVSYSESPIESDFEEPDDSQPK